MGCEIGVRLLAIGKMAAMNHTTVPTLRLYDRLGLLKRSGSMTGSDCSSQGMSIHGQATGTTTSSRMHAST